VEPLHIMDKKETVLWNQAIIQVKVQWKHFNPEEATWELEDVMRKTYLVLFQGWPKIIIIDIEDGVKFKGESVISPNKLFSKLNNFLKWKIQI